MEDDKDLVPPVALFSVGVFLIFVKGGVSYVNSSTEDSID